MTKDIDKKHEKDLESRRKALKKILIGGGVVAGSGFIPLPDKWLPPGVETITVPAHAATSGIPVTTTTTTTSP